MDYFKLSTPCFIVDEQKFNRNAQSFRQALDEAFLRSIVSYSVKTNSLPYLLELARRSGCFAEVVSFNEYELARWAGFAPSEIVYNGPLKDERTFIEAVRGGAYVNIENFREIEWLDGISPTGDEHIGIRLNIDLGRISPDDAKEGEERSRFGLSFENGDFSRAVSEVGKRGFRVSGIHAHRTSATRSLDVYTSIGRYIQKVAESLELELDYIDVGGGFYGDLPGKPSFEDYAQAIKCGLGAYCDCAVIVEPGNGLIASPVDYLFEIMDVKNIGDEAICASNGSRIDVDPFFHKKSYFCELITEGESCDATQVITGSTCLENDVITKLSGVARLSRGDRVLFKCVGAYTSTLSPNFIKLLPSVYSFDGETCKIVRKCWSVSEWVQGSEQPAKVL